MSLNPAVTAEIITKYQRAAGDTGSPEVQIALLTHRIQELTPHFETHKKDNHSRRGLQHMVNARRKLLEYLKRTAPTIHKKLLSDLGLRG